MIRSVRSIALLAGLMAMTGIGFVPASAQSPLKELRARQDEEASLSREAAYTGDVCGIDLDAEIDWRRADDWPAEESLAEACDGALGALEATCRSGRKARVAERISSFSCSGDGSGPGLSGSTLFYGAEPGADAYRETRAFLEDAL